MRPRYVQCRVGTIHGDLNDYNIIATTDGRDVASFIDFGDIVKSYIVNDIAVCAAYFMLKKEDPIGGVRVAALAAAGGAVRLTPRHRADASAERSDVRNCARLPLPPPAAVHGTTGCVNRGGGGRAAATA